MAMAMASSSQASICARPFLSHPLHRHHHRSPTALSLRSKQRPICANCNNADILRGSTRTVTTLIGLAATLLKAIPMSASSSRSASAVGALFFASLRERPPSGLNTPLTVVAAGLGKWLDIYSGVLMVRVLLSWFPNIPWERQPLSAIRDLCDPYLNLFRNIIPPVFDTLDVSPLLAFAVLGTLGSILHTAI
ncbi:hypothetical protein VNO78_12919 [Psophocarpus tetragonolobus]|uniref:Uncharacterized protein n=1 Tax=Psophocarpus tetragonolobus TaxID=3891 RepID=A0AAN9SRP7_PSOTE